MFTSIVMAYGVKTKSKGTNTQLCYSAMEINLLMLTS